MIVTESATQVRRVTPLWLRLPHWAGDRQQREFGDKLSDLTPRGMRSGRQRLKGETGPCYLPSWIVVISSRKPGVGRLDIP